MFDDVHRTIGGDFSSSLDSLFLAVLFLTKNAMFSSCYKT